MDEISKEKRPPRVRCVNFKALIHRSVRGLIPGGEGCNPHMYGNYGPAYLWAFFEWCGGLTALGLPPWQVVSPTKRRGGYHYSLQYITALFFFFVSETA